MRPTGSLLRICIYQIIATLMLNKIMSGRFLSDYSVWPSGYTKIPCISGSDTLEIYIFGLWKQKGKSNFQINWHVSSPSAKDRWVYISNHNIKNYGRRPKLKNMLKSYFLGIFWPFGQKSCTN